MKDERRRSRALTRAIKSVEQLRCTGHGETRRSAKATVEFRTTSLDEAARIEGFQLKLNGKWTSILRCLRVELTDAGEPVFVFAAKSYHGYLASDLAVRQIRDQEKHNRRMRRLKLESDRVWWKQHQHKLLTEP